jgi:hypothetical protein
MKSIIALLAAIAILFAAPAMSFAGGGKSKRAHGKVTAVDAQSITISRKKSGDSKTFQIDDSTKVTVDGQEGKHASDITVGMKARITPGAKPDTAGSIAATTKGKGKKAKQTT